MNNEWISVNKELPKLLQTVWISNGKGWTTLGCLADTGEGYIWAESNGIIYEENGEIIAECEGEDLDVQYWYPVPKPISI